MAATSATTATASAPPCHVSIEDETLSKLSRDGIKHKLRLRNKKISENKQEMIDWLKKEIQDQAPVVGAKKKAAKKKSDRGDGEKEMRTFPKTACWKILKPDDNPKYVPSNPAFKNTQAPTIEERNVKYVSVKFNFSSCKFEIPIFSFFKIVFCNGQTDARRRTRTARFRQIELEEKRGV